MTDTKNSDYEAYMKRVGKETIPAYEPTMYGKEIEYIKDVLQRNWLSESKYTRIFEEKLAAYCERKHAVAFANATAALISGMRARGIGYGDEVIVPSLSHPADPNSVSVIGASVVFADVDEHSMCVTPETIDAVRTDKTKAVLFISVYGNTGDLDAIEQYCKDNKLIFIHDCAPALGTTFKGKKASSYGDFTVLSFFADKTITTGEGGLLLTDDNKLASEANIYKHDGRKERGVDQIDRKGYNFRITELQTALGVAQLEELDNIISTKKKNLATYKELLGERIVEFNPDADVVPHRVMVRVEDAKSLIKHLVHKGIGARSVFMPMHLQPSYNQAGTFPATEKLFKTIVCLPSAPTLTKENIEFIAHEITEWHK